MNGKSCELMAINPNFIPSSEPTPRAETVTDYKPASWRDQGLIGIEERKRRAEERTIEETP